MADDIEFALTPRELWEIETLREAFVENSDLAATVNGSSQPEIVDYVCPIDIREVV